MSQLNASVNAAAGAGAWLAGGADAMYSSTYERPPQPCHWTGPHSLSAPKHGGAAGQHCDSCSRFPPAQTP
jgi:hypothetical protein